MERLRIKHGKLITRTLIRHEKWWEFELNYQRRLHWNSIAVWKKIPCGLGYVQWNIGENYVCMYVCMYACMHSYTYAHMQYMYVCIHVTYQIHSRRGFGLDIGYIGHFSTQLVITLNYSAIADIHTLLSTPAHAESFSTCSVFSRRFLVTSSNNGYSSASVLKSSLNGSSLPTA
jgi:hypothetical protein